VGAARSVSHTSNSPGMDATWWTRDLPVPDVAVRLLEDHDLPEVTDMARETGFDAEDMAHALADMDGAYIDLQKTMGVVGDGSSKQ
jgi:hypothetical protein